MSSGTVHHDDFQVQHSDSFWIKCLCCLLGSRKFKSHMRRGAKGPNSMSKIDKVSRVLFPVTFVIIMIIYWRIYAVDHDEVEDWIDDT